MSTFVFEMSSVFDGVTKMKRKKITTCSITLVLKSFSECLLKFFTVANKRQRIKFADTNIFNNTFIMWKVRSDSWSGVTTINPIYIKTL